MEDIGKKSSVNIVVKASMPKTELLGYDPETDSYKMNVHAPAEDNKANIEIIKFFSRLTKKEVKIVKGLTGKRKTLRFI